MTTEEQIIMDNYRILFKLHEETASEMKKFLEDLAFGRLPAHPATCASAFMVLERVHEMNMEVFRTRVPTLDEL